MTKCRQASVVGKTIGLQPPVTHPCRGKGRKQCTYVDTHIKDRKAGIAPRMAAATSAQQVTVPEEQVAQAIENIGDLLNQATFRPHIEDGQPAGISITGIKPNAIFRKLRLRNGDVITGVNGQTIASVEDAMSVFGTLSTDGPIQVNIKRRGREETLEYRIE